MDEYAWVVDLVVVILVIVSAYLAMVRGLARELFALASWVIAFFAAFTLAPAVKPMLPQLDGFGEILRGCEAQLLISFVLVFGVSLLVTGALFWWMSGPTTDSRVGAVDSALGFAYGALRGLVLVAVLYLAYQQAAVTQTDWTFVEQAFTIDIVRASADMLTGLMPSEPPAWFTDRVTVMLGSCEE